MTARFHLFPKLRPVALLLSCSLVFSGVLRAEEAGAFSAPRAYPLERYEPGWAKNPFTLKTAPVAMQRESFAKDLALGSMYEVGESTTVIIVNTKTRERTALRGHEPAEDGILLKKAVIADTRRESYAVVELAGEEATLRYDEAFLKQMLAGKGSTSAEAEKKGEGAPTEPDKPSATVAAARTPGAPAPGPPSGEAMRSLRQGGAAGVPAHPSGSPRGPTAGFTRPSRPTTAGRRMGTAPAVPPGPAAQPRPTSR